MDLELLEILLFSSGLGNNKTLSLKTNGQKYEEVSVRVNGTDQLL